MYQFVLFICVTVAFPSFGQYPFEKYSAINYKELIGWKQKTESHSVEYTLNIPAFFKSKEALNIHVRSFTAKWDSSYITLSRNDKQVERAFELMYFTETFPSLPVRVADINDDGLNDIKLIVPYMGTGLASMNVRVIYLFQRNDGGFTKVSYTDKMGEKEAWENRAERDLDGDGKYEIITQALVQHGGHSYWAFNLFTFKNNDLVSVNEKFGYPILVQLLSRDNYKITDKVSRKKMKDFAQKSPDDYDRK